MPAVTERNESGDTTRPKTVVVRVIVCDGEPLVSICQVAVEFSLVAESRVSAGSVP
jgi:hypothetical protein